VGNAHYGFFRDELYFIACGRHPALGYVDQPPLVPWLAALTQISGHSLFALRLVPALAAAALTWVTATLARGLGGDRFAQVLAAICATLAPVLCLQGVLFSPDVFQPLVWTSTVLLLHRPSSGEGERPRGWWLGATLGIGALSKFSIAFFGFALLLGLLVTPARRVLRMRATWIGLAIGCALGLPSVFWQLAHGMPFLELLRNGSGQERRARLRGLAGGVVMNPLPAPVWLRPVGPATRRAAMDRLTYLTLYAVSSLLHGKDYHLSAIYPRSCRGRTAFQWMERVRGCGHCSSASRWLEVFSCFRWRC
jgi:4-amino-4-deoxy-L-arabinose transferase-like glycosyltransferase